MLPEKLTKKLKLREENNALRELNVSNELVDFSSNDYIGFSKSEVILQNASRILKEKNMMMNGATGSRLLSGNHSLYNEVEQVLCDYHNAPAALVFNSGYDANIGFFSSVPQKGDFIFYDEYVHASIRDGIRMSHAKSYKFKHNDFSELAKKITRFSSENLHSIEIYIVTESVFSMDGDIPDLEALITISNNYNCHLVIDEAHAVGVFNGGLVQQLELEHQVFARIITFGKGIGCHGAAILGSESLKNYLVNFARSFIYTTGLPPHSLATILAAYTVLPYTPSIKKLAQNIDYFKSQITALHLDEYFIASNSAIHCCIISGNTNVKSIADQLQKEGFDVKAILSPTVPSQHERLRFCIHSFNTQKEIMKVLEVLCVLFNKE